MDVAGHADVHPVSTAIAALIQGGKEVTVLGSFPRSQPAPK